MIIMIIIIQRTVKYLFYPDQHPDRVGERRAALGEDHRAGHRGGPLRRADPPEAAREVDRGEADGTRGHPVRGGPEEQAQVRISTIKILSGYFDNFL